MITYPVMLTIRADNYPTQYKRWEKIERALSKSGFKDIKRSSTLTHDLEATISNRTEMGLLKKLHRFYSDNKKEVLDIIVSVDGHRIGPMLRS